MPLLMPRPAASPRLFRAARPSFAAAALALAAACSSGDATSPDASVVGTYQLVTYQNLALPYLIDEQAGVSRAELVDGVLDLRSDRTFTADARTRVTDLQTGEATTDGDPILGSYLVRGNIITFTNTGESSFDGSQAEVSGNTVTLGPFAFRR